VNRILLPAIGKARDTARVNTSKNNLRQMGVAHKTYAADWSDRHLTFVRDSLGLYHGDVVAYNNAIYGGTETRYDAHPGIIAGDGYDSRHLPPLGHLGAGGQSGPIPAHRLPRRARLRGLGLVPRRCAMQAVQRLPQ
jgi:hypothetical protein